VALLGRRVDPLEEVASLITDQGGTCVALPCDVTDTANLETAVSRAEEALGVVTILVNNAGMPDARYATRMEPEFVDKVIATNLTAPFLLSCEVARRLMVERVPGRIVNISSMGAYRYDGNGAALYSITKAAINRLTEVLAVEWAKFDINVNAIAPGAFASEMMDGMTERLGEFWRRFPRKRLGEPSQLDSTLLYLVSPQSEAVTGTIVKVDDGQMSR
jgi:NAD(P)-dependent dehydrogenase (short-subunit alcohol dehydrogenase family)